MENASTQVTIEKYIRQTDVQITMHYTPEGPSLAQCMIAILASHMKDPA